MKKRILILIIIVITLSISVTYIVQKQNQSSSDDQDGINVSNNETQENKYKIGAYYFGMFSSDSLNETPSLTKAAEITYKRKDDIWGGVRDFYGKEPAIPANTSIDRDYGDYKPYIGYYDATNTSVLEKQITQATYYGLDYFNFYWYWDSATQNDKYVGGLRTFNKARNANEMEFMLTIVSGTQAHTLTQIPEEDYAAASSKIVSYFEKSNYIKYEERPVIYLYDVTGIGSGSNEDVIKFINKLTQITQNKMQTDPYVVLFPTKDISGFEQDGRSCLHPTTVGAFNLKTYDNYIKDLQSFYSQYGSQSFLYCMLQNVDWGPRYGIGVKDISGVVYLDGMTVDKFRTALEEVKSSMDKSTSPMSDHLTIYAWNEWHEGGFIEPNIRDGAVYLEAIQNVFGLQSNTNSCTKYGLCDLDSFKETETFPFSFIGSTIAGNVDNVTDEGTIRGWAMDLDKPTSTIAIHIYKGNTYGQGGTKIGNITTTVTRADVNQKYNTSNTHGFEFKIPQEYIDGNPDNYYIYGINIAGTNGNNALIDGSPITYSDKVNTCQRLDINSDNILTIIDFIAFKKSYGTFCTTDEEDPDDICDTQDTNNDGKINIIDFIFFKKNYNQPDICTP